MAQVSGGGGSYSRPASNRKNAETLAARATFKGTRYGPTMGQVNRAAVAAPGQAVSAVVHAAQVAKRRILPGGFNVGPGQAVSAVHAAQVAKRRILPGGFNVGVPALGAGNLMAKNTSAIGAAVGLPNTSVSSRSAPPRRALTRGPSGNAAMNFGQRMQALRDGKLNGSTQPTVNLSSHRGDSGQRKASNRVRTARINKALVLKLRLQSRSNRKGRQLEPSTPNFGRRMAALRNPGK